MRTAPSHGIRHRSRYEPIVAPSPPDILAQCLPVDLRMFTPVWSDLHGVIEWVNTSDTESLEISHALLPGFRGVAYPCRTWGRPGFSRGDDLCGSLEL
jgi:hypothetical protein